MHFEVSQMNQQFNDGNFKTWPDLVHFTQHAADEAVRLLGGVDTRPPGTSALKNPEPLAPLQKDLELPGSSQSKQHFGVERSFMAVPALQCDHRPQSPWVTAKAVADDCDVPLETVYPKVKDAVAQAVVKQPDGSINWGAAFKYCDDKSKKCVYITNAHVAEDADQVGLVARDGKTVSYGRVLAQDLVHDLAIVDVPQGDTRPSVKTGHMPKVGDPVFTVGHPYGIPGDVVSSGHVLELNYTITDVDSGQSYNGLTESDIMATPGNSGGPEFNKKGEVIGIKSNAGANGTSMSIPIQTAIDLIK
jgi:S1-C subfamily serine protease